MEGGEVVTYSWVERDKVLGQRRRREFRFVRKSNKEFW